MKYYRIVLSLLSLCLGHPATFLIIDNKKGLQSPGGLFRKIHKYLVYFKKH